MFWFLFTPSLFYRPEKGQNMRVSQGLRCEAPRSQVPPTDRRRVGSPHRGLGRRVAPACRWCEAVRFRYTAKQPEIEERVAATAGAPAVCSRGRAQSLGLCRFQIIVTCAAHMPFAQHWLGNHSMHRSIGSDQLLTHSLKHPTVLQWSCSDSTHASC